MPASTTGEKYIAKTTGAYPFRVTINAGANRRRDLPTLRRWVHSLEEGIRIRDAFLAAGPAIQRFVHHRRGRVDMLLQPTGARHVDYPGVPSTDTVPVRATERGTPELDLILRTEDEVDRTLRAIDPHVHWYVEFKAQGQATDVNTVVGQLARRVLVHDYDSPARKAAVFGTAPSDESEHLLESQHILVLVRP